MRRTVPALTVAVLGLAAVGCSGEDAAESIIENAIESESGENVDIDLGDLTDGDGFSIDTGEGSMSVDEDGNFVITDENGEVITGDVNMDGSGIDISSDDGSFSMESDDEGNVTFETDEGTISGGTATEIPEEWPDGVPEPTGFEIESATQFSDGSMANVSIIGASGDGEAWVTQYGESLLAAGFTELSKIETAESLLVGYEMGPLNVNLQTVDNGDGTWLVSVGATSQPE